MDEWGEVNWEERRANRVRGMEERLTTLKNF